MFRHYYAPSLEDLTKLLAREGTPKFNKGWLDYDDEVTDIYPQTHGQIWKNRETNQLFYLRSIEGQEYEGVFGDPNITDDKTKYPYHYTIEPLFMPYAVVSFGVKDVAERTTYWSADASSTGSFYTADKIVLNAVSAGLTDTPSNTNLHCAPYFLHAPYIGGIDQFCAISNTEDIIENGIENEDGITVKVNDELSLVNPLIVGKSAETNEDYQSAGYLGNFVYAHCAVYYPRGLLIGTTSGLWQCTITGNQILSMEQVVISNGNWIPLNMMFVYTNDPDISYLYVTAVFNIPNRYPYLYNFGMDVTHHVAGSEPLYENHNQPVRDFSGRCVVIKFELSKGAFSKNKVSVVYSHFGAGGDIPPAFENEMGIEFDAQFHPTGRFCQAQTFYMGEQNHSTIMYEDTGQVSQVSNSVFDLSTFVVNVDSLAYVKDETWDYGIFFKKQENPFFSIHDVNGGSIRNALIIGQGLPIDASAVRLVGYTVNCSEELPGEVGSWHGDVEEGEPVTMTVQFKVDPNIESGLSCEIGACRYPRGHRDIIQYGNITIGSDGKVFLLSTWDSESLYTSFLAHRGFYIPKGGFTEWCDVTYYYPTCGMSMAYYAANTMGMLCSFYYATVTANPGTLALGAYYNYRYWGYMCGFGTPHIHPLTSGTGLAGTGAPVPANPECEPLRLGGRAFFHRNYNAKTDKYYFLDILTSQHSIFDITGLRFLPYEYRTFANLRGRDLDDSIGGFGLPDSWRNFNIYDLISDEGQEKVGRVIHDFRNITDYHGPSLNYDYYSDIEDPLNSDVLSDNPHIEVEDNGITVGIQGSDTIRTMQMMDWAAGGITDWKQYFEKQLEVVSNLEFSAYYYAHVRQFNNVTLIKRLYEVDGEGFLEDVLNSEVLPSGAEATAADKECMVDLVDSTGDSFAIHWNTSFDWAFYSPVGQASTCYSQQKENYVGRSNFGKTLIFEGYSVSSSSGIFEIITKDDGQGLKDIYGGPDNFHLDSEVLRIVRSVTFYFTLKRETNKAGPFFNHIFAKEPGFEATGTITEYYLVSKTPETT